MVVNYFEHIKRFDTIIDYYPKMTASHVSLYYALFNLWNKSMFKPVIYISRQFVMKKSKIGSRTTYYKCMQDLEEWKFLKYHPALNGITQSRVQMAVFTDEYVDNIENITSTDAEMHYFIPSTCPKSLQARDSACSNLIQVHEQAQTKIDTSTGTHNRHITNTSKTKELETCSSPSQIINNLDFNSIDKRKKVALKKERETPELHEVKAYFAAQDKTDVEAAKFFYYYEASNWIGSNKNPITNWRALAEKWMRNNFNTKQFYPDYSTHLNKKINYNERL